MDTGNTPEHTGRGTPLLIAGCGSPDVLKMLNAINTAGDKPVYDILGCLEVDAEKIENGWHGHRVWDERAISASDFPPCAIANNTSGIPMRRRQKVTAGLREKGFTRFDSIVDPRVDLYEVQVGEGCQILLGADIGPHVSIGDFSILLLGSNVNHDVTLGQYCFIGPNATVLGRVTLEEGVYVGAGAVIFPEVTVGAWSVIGAGSVVRKSVPPGVVMTGNPATFVRRMDSGKGRL